MNDKVARIVNRLAWACTLPPLLLALYLAYHHLHDEREGLEREAQFLSRGLASTVDQHLHARIAGLQMLAASPLIDDARRHAELYQSAQGYRLSFNSHVVLADLDMHMLFNTRAPYGAKLPDLPRPKGHSAVQLALQSSGPAVGDVFAGPIAKEPLVAIALPVQRNGRVHLLLSPFETRQLDAYLKASQLPPGWILSLRDGSDQTIARRGPELSAEELQGAQRFQTASTLGAWSAVLEIPKPVYQAHLRSTALQLLLALAAAAALSLFFAAWAKRRIARAFEAA